MQDETLQLAEFEIQIIRSKRKSISLQVKPEHIIIRAPSFSPRLALKAFTLSKINWLRKTHQRIQSSPSPIKSTYNDGDQFLFKGQPIILRTAAGSISSTQFNSHTQTLSIIVGNRVKNTTPFIKKQIAEWYKQEALHYIQNSAQNYANQMDVTFQEINVRDYKARWGSCSAKGKLSFNWRILMAPPSVIDSVIVHELAHIKHFNHSKQFWSLVYMHYPDYKQQHDWLKDNQYRLAA